MLGKLLKHEFRATARIMWVLYAAMLALSLGAHFSLRYMQGGETYLALRVLATLVAVFWVLALIFGAVMTLVLMIQRFHKNLLTDEGYLMFTLPVSLHALIFSKIIVSVVWSFITGVVVILGVLVAMFDIQFIEILRQIVLYYNGEALKLTLQGAGMLSEVLLLALIGGATSMLQFYGAMSLGYGFTGHKALWSVVWYFIIGFVIQMITMGLMLGLGNSILTGIVNEINLGVTATWHLTILGAAAIDLVIGAVLYIVTWLNLKNRLNLA